MINKKTNKQKQLNKLHELYKKCTSCSLYTPERNKIVFGEGNPNAKLMLIGEGPGKEEDLSGRPFVGRSGKLLRKSLEQCGIPCDDIFITNIVKCRPPNNRNPKPEEVNTCKKILLFNQIEIIKPKIIATVGACSLKLFAKTNNQVKISKIHGQGFMHNNILIVPLYHPAYILRNNTKLPDFLNDISHLKRLLDEKQY